MSSRLALRTLFTGGGALIAAVVLVRATNAALFASTPYPKRVTVQSQVRMRELVSHLPEIAATKGDVVIATGPSTMLHGFAPALFEEELGRAGIHVTSFNAAFVAFTPEIMHLLAKRIHDAFDAQGKRVALSIVELSPEMATFAPPPGFIGWPSQKAILSDRHDLVDIGKRSPTEALRVAALKTVGYERARVTTSLVSVSLFDSPGWWPIPAPPPRTAFGKLNAIMSRIYVNMEAETHGQEWDSVRRGEYRLRFDSTERDYANMMELTTTDDVLKEDLQFYVRCCDILELHFDPFQVEQLVRTIAEFQAFSERVMVVILPRDARYVRPSPDASARLAEMKRLVVARTGAPLVDLTGRVEHGALLDVAHANDISGKREFAALLADEARVRWNTPR